MCADYRDFIVFMKFVRNKLILNFSRPASGGKLKAWLVASLEN